MAFIAFLGCDGCGKSAVIAGTAKRLAESGLKVELGHWRPQFIKLPVESGEANAENPHALPPRGALSSMIKLLWLWFNWWGGWFLVLRSASNAGAVLFDRYHADLLVDPRRYRYGGPAWAARIASFLMPRPDLVFYLDAPADVLLSRKQEVSKAALEAGRDAYLALARNHPHITVIDASRPLEEVTEVITRLVSRKLHGGS